MPYFRSFMSFGVSEGAETLTPGRLIPLCSFNKPPIITVQVTVSLLLEATFPWAKGMADAQYTLQVSQDMKTWNDFENFVEDKQDGEFAEMITLTGEIDADGDTPVFARILVSVIDL